MCYKIWVLIGFLFLVPKKIFFFLFLIYFEVKCDLVRFRHLSIYLSRHVRPRWEAVAGVVFLAWLFSLIKASQPPTTPSTHIL